MKTTGAAALHAPELWGGIECSVVRIGGAWRDQVRETGHHRRAGADIDLVASLGCKAVRYPVLWERVRAGQPGACGWSWHDRQLSRLERRGIRIIAGLVHHGSGPRGTSLLDPRLPERLAAYASQVAARYPFVAAWTPINEPLTTARFSCLYGFWHPHVCDTDAFLRAVANQARAILFAMRAIRARLPDARFIHTEDLGRVFATAPLQHQADYENERRWLSLDLLCGRVGRDHPWREDFERSGVPVTHLQELESGEAAPDVIGINHYATSDRFLDHRWRLYPPHLRGGNGYAAYADTEAVRADLGDDATGWAPRLREACRRYRRPIAVTEAHLGCCDPHEQVRWLLEAWQAAQRLRAEGHDVRAVTAWALFGLVDWNSLLRERSGHYEPGAFDVSENSPRPTLLAEAIAALAAHGEYSHPILERPGWWRLEDRIHAALRRA
jgi:beta-glucosidase/6-phospho-beta-glucosidase/beta-galactosidase